jgi:hypothetical protein
LYSGGYDLIEPVFECNNCFRDAQFEARTGHAILERYGMAETVMITSNPLDGGRIPGSSSPTNCRATLWARPRKTGCARCTGIGSLVIDLESP